MGLLSSKKTSTSVSQGAQQGLTVDQSGAEGSSPVTQVTAQGGTGIASVRITQTLTDFGALERASALADRALSIGDAAGRGSIALAGDGLDAISESFLAQLDETGKAFDKALDSTRDLSAEELDRLLLLIGALAAIGAAAYIFRGGIG